ncbi:glycine zipper 2TM domain-containing protein [Novosphingobium sp. 1949]|uniref:17 kDa surface antigen n=1 Tax=Novosphingobium organovorum TaxID=2930092 RepID=A0ABT0BIY8_9SPHN|nr:glycine zipper 2TM domain-containing protein [Novosphingobium organovorum]MCJ2184905.1 glycine zipper 2TM domain-containing protein [Novosphingobium organovorum]
MRNLILAATMAAVAAPSLVVATATPAMAREHHRYHRTDNGIRYWKDDHGRYRCRKSDGTTGLLIGGVAGALAGRAVDTHGDRTTGTVLGAAAGALLGREVDRSSSRPHCR